MIYSHATLSERIVDRVLIQTSRKSRVDGLWVSIFWEIEERGQETLDRLVEALQLIKRCDPYRYALVMTETDRLSAELVPGSTSYWVRPLRRCALDCRFVLERPPEVIAAEIVRRTTYGRLVRYRVADPLEVAYRHRVEEFCTAQALTFASKLHDGSEVISWLRSGLLHPSDLSQRANRERFLDGEINVGREAGLPDWLVRALQRRRDRKRARTNRKDATQRRV